MASAILVIPNISCEHCVRTVTEALTPIEGVQDVKVELRTKQVQVDYDAACVGIEQLEQALDAEDYPVAATTTF